MPVTIARQGNNLPNGVFLPTIWSKKLNAKYYAQTFLNDITNSDYEGEIAGQGSQVNIRQRPTVEVVDHQEDSDIEYQDISDEMISLSINYAKRFAFKVGDIDKAQSDIAILNELTTDAGFQMKISIDQTVLGSIYGSAGTVLPTITLDKTNVVDWLIDQEVALELNNIPPNQRWAVISPKVAGLIQKSDLKNVSLTGDTKSIIRSNLNNGRLGEVGGLTLYVSNNLARAGNLYQCVSGHKSAVTYASQITKVENVRLERKFGDAVRGLNVYGFKVLIPSGLVSAPVYVN
jgi:hypothetical protein